MDRLNRTLGRLVVLAAFAAGCKGGDGVAAPPTTLPPKDTTTPPPTPPPTPTTPGKDELTIVSGGSGSDTIQARLEQPLVVEVRVQGALRAGVTVQFASLPPANPTRNLEKTALVGRVGDDQFSPVLSVTTEADGRARVGIALGTVTEEARVVISAPTLALSDTARYVVQAGAAKELLVPVRDTALLANARYALGAWALDRFRNRRPEPPTFTSVNALGSVDAAGNVQLSSTVGRGRIAIRTGSIVDTAAFVVVPPDVISTMRGDVMSIRLDGSAKTVWQPPPGSAGAGVLSPTGDVMAFWAGDYKESSIYLVDRAGAARRLIPASRLSSAYGPRFSRDGAWVYFYSSSIWRIRTDGTQLEELATPVAGSVNGLREPAVSSDGRRIIFADSDERSFVMLDLVTGERRTIAPAPGTTPLFSPDGLRIAYDAGAAVGMINVNGTGQRYFGCPASGCYGVGWTKDGRWLITQAFDWVAMVNVSTGEWIIVPGTRGSYSITVQE